MSNNKFMNKISRSCHRVGFSIKKHSPEILIVSGVVGVVASTVMACKATTKLDSIMSDSKEKITAIHKGMEEGNIKNVEYTVEDGKKDLTIVYAKTGLEIVKLYAPSVLLGTASLAAIISSHNILHKRNVALAAAYATVDKTFKQYRGRVVERFGKELDRELRYNIKSKEIEEIVTDEKGKEKVVKENVQVAEVDKYSEYAKVFDEYCTGWTKDPQQNLMFLRQQQAYLNDLLKVRGHVFLNEVYDRLGIPRTPEGQMVGWLYNSDDEYSDNYIDFGIYDINDEQKRLFINGYERSIILDFNPDGVIYNLIRNRDGL